VMMMMNSDSDDDDSDSDDDSDDEFVKKRCRICYLLKSAKSRILRKDGPRS